MQLLVARHAHAGSRSEWVGADLDRPLSPRGHDQAERIADVFARSGVTRAISSPAVRCVQTLAPLARELGIEVEVDPVLLEGSDHREVLDLVESLAASTIVCSHGDVIPDLLRSLRKAGLAVADELRWPKGSVWVAERDGATWTSARYVMPSGSRA